MKYPETREPLEQLKDALRRGYLLVSSCKDCSYLYFLAMGWNIIYQFRKALNEIDNYLRLVRSSRSSTMPAFGLVISFLSLSLAYLKIQFFVLTLEC